jgi:hypothetical protein
MVEFTSAKEIPLAKPTGTCTVCRVIFLWQAIRHLREMSNLGLKPDARSFASALVKSE